MALSKNITVKAYGKNLNFDDAYIKASSLTGTKDQVDVKICIFSAKDGELLETTYVRFVPSMTGANFIKQAYEHLKTLPEFAGSTDC
jgi:hypothetical protein